MYNVDGSEGEMCGNGIRCFAKFVLERGHGAGQRQHAWTWRHPFGPLFERAC